jgi:acyl dehydratase
MVRYMDDFDAGQSFESPAVAITEADIYAFARQFDPQPFHLDPAAATASVFQGLAASGWHTAALCYRLLLDSGIGFVGGIVGTGIDEMRWLKPVRPGDTLTLVTRIENIEPSPRNPDRGVLRMSHRASNQAAEAVYTFRSSILTRRATDTERAAHA